MLLKESQLDNPDNIIPILGKPYKESGKLLTVTGSSIYFLRECTDLKGNPLPLKRDQMKAIFQRYEKGLFLLLNGSNYRNGILISTNTLKKIMLSKHSEERSSWNNLSFRIFSKFADLPILGWLTKLFRYKLRETHLDIETDFFKAKMITSYSSFESQVDYFNKLGISDKVEIIN